MKKLKKNIFNQVGKEFKDTYNIGGNAMGIFAVIGALMVLFLLFIVAVYLESTIENSVTNIINGILKGIFSK